MTQDNWVTIGTMSDIPQNGARLVKTQFGDIGIFRTGDDQIFAIEDMCPHLGGSLSQGIVHGKHVTCPLHNWVISLASGEATGADEGKVVTIPVRIEDDKITIQLKPAEMMAAKELA